MTLNAIDETGQVRDVLVDTDGNLVVDNDTLTAMADGVNGDGSLNTRVIDSEALLTLMINQNIAVGETQPGSAFVGAAGQSGRSTLLIYGTRNTGDATLTINAKVSMDGVIWYPWVWASGTPPSVAVTGSGTETVYNAIDVSEVAAPYITFTLTAVTNPVDTVNMSLWRAS